MCRFLFQTTHDVCLMLDREAAGREATPSGGVIDRQSIKAPYAKERGYDAGRKIVGRKRHIAVDTDDRLLLVRLTPTDISDSAGRQMILNAIRKRWPWEASCYAEPLIREFPKRLLQDQPVCAADPVIPASDLAESPTSLHDG